MALARFMVCSFVTSVMVELLRSLGDRPRADDITDAEIAMEFSDARKNRR
jgi:hypothetical protein